MSSHLLLALLLLVPVMWGLWGVGTYRPL